MKDRVLKVMSHREKGLLTETEMWQEILEIAVHAIAKESE
jgi:hypothetical protein